MSSLVNVLSLQYPDDRPQCNKASSTRGESSAIVRSGDYGIHQLPTQQGLRPWPPTTAQSRGSDGVQDHALGGRLGGYLHCGHSGSVSTLASLTKPFRDDAPRRAAAVGKQTAADDDVILLETGNRQQKIGPEGDESGDYTTMTPVASKSMLYQEEKHCREDVSYDSEISSMTNRNSTLTRVQGNNNTTQSAPSMLKLKLRIDDALIEELNRVMLAGSQSCSDYHSTRGAVGTTGSPGSPNAEENEASTPRPSLLLMGPNKGEKKKLKASYITAQSLQIGAFKCMACHSSDLVAKIYYAKKRMLWEVLDNGLKKKIEFLWSDISKMRVNFKGQDTDIWEFEMSSCPTFHEEVEPQPMKHTNWQPCHDFTGGQASDIRLTHRLSVEKGQNTRQHYEKLLAYCPHLKSMMANAADAEALCDEDYQEQAQDREPIKESDCNMPSLFSLKRHHPSPLLAQPADTSRLFEIQHIHPEAANCVGNFVESNCAQDVHAYYDDCNVMTSFCQQAHDMACQGSMPTPLQSDPSVTWSPNSTTYYGDYRPQPAMSCTEMPEFSVGREQLSHQVKRLRPNSFEADYWHQQSRDHGSWTVPCQQPWECYDDCSGYEMGLPQPMHCGSFMAGPSGMNFDETPDRISNIECGDVSPRQALLSNSTCIKASAIARSRPEFAAASSKNGRWSVSTRSRGLKSKD
eukprot:scaffold319681_cov47-Prasinocladus_malaysianus.AAC.2